MPTRAAFKQLYIPSNAVFDCGLVVILLFAAAVMACASAYNFKIMSFAEAGLFRYRQPPYFPVALRYSMGAITSVLLPFAFACFVEKRQYWFASLALALLVGFYPILLMKTVLFTPVWLVILAKTSELTAGTSFYVRRREDLIGCAAHGLTLANIVDPLAQNRMDVSVTADDLGKPRNYPGLRSRLQPLLHCCFLPPILPVRRLQFILST
jgi:hypothetical protein